MDSAKILEQIIGALKSGEKLDIVQLQASTPEQNELLNTYSALHDALLKKEREIKASEEFNESLIETANDVFVCVDAEGIIKKWNNKAVEVFGWSKEEAIGSEMSDMIIPESFREAHRKGMRRYLETGEGVVLGKTLELSALNKEGDELPVELTIWPVHIGDEPYFNSFIRDITIRKQALKDLERATADAKANEEEFMRLYESALKQKKELEVAQTQMLQQEKLASIGQLAAGVAHEINNPMNFIGLNLQTLSEYLDDYARLFEVVARLKDVVSQDNLDEAHKITEELSAMEKKVDLEFVSEDVGKLLEQSKTGVERVRKIVMDLRSFSRSEGDEAVSVKVSDVIDNVLDIVMNEIKYKADVEKEYSDVPMIKGHPQRLGQVFINLFVNAAQAMEDRGRIQIRTYREKDNVVIEVSDNGSGIPEENLKNIFDAFYTTKQVGEGTGLGLSISYEIVQQHGGDIIVSSTVGEGTTFSIILPVELTEKLKTKVLVVDDDENMVKLISEWLKRSGKYEVEVAYDGFKAGQVFSQFKPDLVTLDLKMPEMDGFEVCEAMRKEAGPDIKILVLSGVEDEAEKNRILSLGANAYLIKPLNQEAFFNQIDALFA